MSGPGQQHATRGEVSAAISDAMAGLLSRATGRGATSSNTTFGRDVIVCVMGDALTAGEKSLVRSGRPDAVFSIRRAYQETIEQEAVSVVEELSGRRVAAFLSANHIDPDLAVEVFVLHQAADDAADDGTDGRATLG
jgi:uncharacterized protein YbcI